jgi:hypothetical protein
LTVILGLFGIGDVASGVHADELIPLGVTGKSVAELRAESEQAYRLLDLGARNGGMLLILLSILMTTILIIPFRRGERWAWWVMWTLPAFAVAAFIVILVVGVAPGQAPPPPMISGPIFAVLASAILLASAPRFFRADR